jgi:hypothetical protein
MLDIPSLQEIGSELIGRLHGPFAFRFVLQPLVASIYAIRVGVKDAREGKPAYLWSVLTNPAGRRELLMEGLHHVLHVIQIGVAMELLYELIVFKAIRPLQLVVVVLGLAFVPYLIVRGPINRIARRWIGSSKPRKKAA